LAKVLPNHPIFRTYLSLIDNFIEVLSQNQELNALENMKQKGLLFSPGKVTEWLDCGNKNATVYTNQRVLEFDNSITSLKGKNSLNINSLIIEPCFIGENVTLENSIVGPHVSIGDGTIVKDAIIKNCIIQSYTKINKSIIENSMIGEGAEINGKSLDLSVSDYSTINH
jgi:glucose-1-phosphate thymidylyltransferase